MAPIAIDTPAAAVQQDDIATLKAKLQGLHVDNIQLPPDNTLRRYQKAGIDLSNGYPYFPPKPDYVQDVKKIRAERKEYVDPASRADPEKKALFAAAKTVKNLTTHLGVRLLPCACEPQAYDRPKSPVCSSKISQTSKRTSLPFLSPSAASSVRRSVFVQ